APPGPELVPGDAGPYVERRGVAMGTELYAIVLTEDRARAEEAIRDAFAEIARVEALMTDWKETSQLSAVNRAAGEHAVKVDRELLDLLDASKKISELTSGTFDVTYAGAGRFWDFQADPPKLPDPEDIKRAIAKIDY